MADSEKKLPQPVSILMPVSNEADIIEGVVEEWVRDVFRHLPEGSEFLFDEAGSVDGTRAILKRMCEKYPFIRVNYNETKDGFPAAARRLYGSARCPLIFFTDSDGQYIASEFWKLAPYAADFSIVHGAKINRKDPVIRKVASAAFNFLVRLLFGVNYVDINSAYRIVKREALDVLPDVRCMPTLLSAEFLLRAEFKGYPIKQVRVMHRRREFGVSRGLPPAYFIRECVKAFWGLLELKKEFKK